MCNWGIKGEIFSFSLSSPFHSLALYASFTFHSFTSFSLSLSFSLSPLSPFHSLSLFLSLHLFFSFTSFSLISSLSLSLFSIFISRVSNGRFRPCFIIFGSVLVWNLTLRSKIVWKGIYDNLCLPKMLID